MGPSRGSDVTGVPGERPGRTLAPGRPGWMPIRSRSSTEGAVHALSALVGEGEQEAVQPGSGAEGEIPRRHPCREDVGQGLPDAVGCLSHRDRLRPGGPIRPPLGLGPQHHGGRGGDPARRGEGPCARLAPIGVAGRGAGRAAVRYPTQGLHQSRRLPVDGSPPVRGRGGFRPVVTEPNSGLRCEVAPFMGARLFPGWTLLAR